MKWPFMLKSTHEKEVGRYKRRVERVKDAMRAFYDAYKRAKRHNIDASNYTPAVQAAQSALESSHPLAFYSYSEDTLLSLKLEHAAKHLDTEINDELERRKIAKIAREECSDDV